MSRRTDTTKYLRALARAGLQVTRQKKHYMVRDPRHPERGVVPLSGSASDHRALMATRAFIRKTFGIDIDPRTG